jgi:hypothetical protein
VAWREAIDGSVRALERLEQAPIRRLCPRPAAVEDDKTHDPEPYLGRAEPFRGALLGQGGDAGDVEDAQGLVRARGQQRGGLVVVLDLAQDILREREGGTWGRDVGRGR